MGSEVGSEVRSEVGSKVRSEVGYALEFAGKSADTTTSTTSTTSLHTPIGRMCVYAYASLPNRHQTATKPLLDTWCCKRLLLKPMVHVRLAYAARML